MKKLLLILYIFILSGCYNSECFYIFPMRKYCDMGERWPLIAQYQKKDTIGHTNSAQRLKDAESCGVNKNDLNKMSANVFYNTEYKKKYYHFALCMKKKGYIEIDNASCGYQKNIYDRGFCNL